MVLSHRTGFPNWRDDYPDKQLFIQFDPGTEYHYSGEGYQYLAKVLKHLLNTNWAGLEAEFQKRVAIPFQMDHTKFIKDDQSNPSQMIPFKKISEVLCPSSALASLSAPVAIRVKKSASRSMVVNAFIRATVC